MLKFRVKDSPLEREIESYGVKEFKKIGVRLDKFTSPGKRSVPDRIALCDDSFTFFIEFKREGQKATANQLREHERLRSLGYVVLVIDSKDNVDKAVGLYKEGKLIEYPKTI
jgi:hypothetical protein